MKSDLDKSILAVRQSRENLFEAFSASSDLRFNLLCFINDSNPYDERLNLVLFNEFLDGNFFLKIPFSSESINVLWICGSEAHLFNEKEEYHCSTVVLSNELLEMASDCIIRLGQPKTLNGAKATLKPGGMKYERYALMQTGLLQAIERVIFNRTELSAPPLDELFRNFKNEADHYRSKEDLSQQKYQVNINLFCSTNGLATDFNAALISLFNPPQRKEQCRSLLGEFNAIDLKNIQLKLQRDGYFHFDVVLEKGLTRELTELAKQENCMLIKDGEPVKFGVPYDRNNVLGPEYQIPEDVLINHPSVHTIVTDPGILEISKNYLGTDPYLDLVTMWWSPVYQRLASSMAAQLFHFDMARLKFLKWFFYLTDVDKESGPHVYVKGSHRRGTYPQILLNRGSVRISDADIIKYYGEDRITEVRGPRGTIMVGDTRCFHKGAAPLKKERLLFELEFSSTLFGNAFTEKSQIRNIPEKINVKNPKIKKLFTKYL